MGRSVIVKWLATNMRSLVGTYGMTKKELVENMRSEEKYRPDSFRDGDKVMILKQLSGAKGYSKIIIYGKHWMLPKADDNDFEKELDREQDAYYRKDDRQVGLRCLSSVD